MLKSGRAVALLSLLAAAALSAAGRGEDINDSKDHSLITRYPGSYIDEYQVTEFDEFNLPMGKVDDGKLVASKHLEGKITMINYAAPAGRSILEVYRNYESALKRGGFAILWSCANAECGDGNPVLFGTHADDWGWGAGHRALSAKLTRGGGEVYISLHIGQWGDLSRGSAVRQYVIEMKAMEGDLIKTDAATLAGDITRTGHTAVYGIYFDTAKADLKPESDGALQEIAKMLQQAPAMKLYVVGHTDNAGGLASNMDLSKRRAEAVAASLASRGVAPARLAAQGCGPLAPVAPNETEDGRAKNRRVELVQQ